MAARPEIWRDTEPNGWTENTHVHVHAHTHVHCPSSRDSGCNCFACYGGQCSARLTPSGCGDNNLCIGSVTVLSGHPESHLSEEPHGPTVASQRADKPHWLRSFPTLSRMEVQNDFVFWSIYFSGFYCCNQCYCLGGSGWMVVPKQSLHVWRLYGCVGFGGYYNQFVVKY